MKASYSQFVSFLTITMVIAIALFMGGCDGSKTPETSESGGSVSPAQQNVLARVQGEPVTAYDVEQTALKMLGPQQSALLDEKGQHKVLESLVLSRAIAHAAQKDLDSDDVASIEWKAQAYREQLMVNSYLRNHADPQPVTEKMIKEYYESNLERFGGGSVREYELIASRERLDGVQRERVLSKLADANSQKDWVHYVDKLVKKNVLLQFRRGKTNTGVTLGELQSVLDSMSVGDVSKPFFVDGKVYLARIVSENKMFPRPLGEVSADIRKTLAPVQLKKAIRKISGTVMKDANIEYTNGPQAH